MTEPSKNANTNVNLNGPVMLILIGAILRYAINQSPHSTVNYHLIGTILMVLGGIPFAVCVLVILIALLMVLIKG